MLTYINPKKDSNIKEIWYARTSEIMYVVFSNDRMYKYFDVSEHVYKSLTEADSKGGFFNKHIKNNKSYKPTELFK